MSKDTSLFLLRAKKKDDPAARTRVLSRLAVRWLGYAFAGSGVDATGPGATFFEVFRFTTFFFPFFGAIALSLNPFLKAFAGGGG